MNKIRPHFLKIIAQPLVAAVFFCLTLYAIESWYFSFDHHLLNKLKIKEYVMPISVNLLLAFISFMILVVGFYITLISGKIWKIIFCGVFSIAAMAEYSVRQATQHFTTVHEWTLLHLSSENQKKDTLTIFFNYHSLVLALFLIVFVYFFGRPKRIKYLNLLKIVYTLFVVIFYTFSYRYTSNNYYTTSLSAFLRSGLAYPSYLSAIYTYEKTPRVPLSYTHKSTERPNDIVFIVDESVRGDHTNFYGYGRQVTASSLLDMEKKGTLWHWKECVAGATASNTSCLLLLTGLVNADLPDVAMKSLTMPTLFQYAKSMNFKTHYLDGQMNFYWNGKQKDLMYIDQWLGMDSFNTSGRMFIDSLIALKIKQILHDTTSAHFIWVNKMGVHYAYEANYPEKSQKWQPISGYRQPTGDAQKDALNQQHIVNNYDNALLFNSQIFWRTLLEEKRIQNGQSTIVYTSDHGQTLGDNGAFWSHNLNTKKEASVPLWIINKPHKFTIDTAFMPHHANIFPTLLDLMAFPYNERPHNYDKSLFVAKNKDNRPRQSWYGHLNRRTPSSNSIPFD